MISASLARLVITPPRELADATTIVIGTVSPASRSYHGRGRQLRDDVQADATVLGATAFLAG